MSNNKSGKSISLVMLLILSSLTGMLILPNSSAAGINQTTSGILNGQELGLEHILLPAMLPLLPEQV